MNELAEIEKIYLNPAPHVRAGRYLHSIGMTEGDFVGKLQTELENSLGFIEAHNIKVSLVDCWKGRT